VKEIFSMTDYSFNIETLGQLNVAVSIEADWLDFLFWHTQIIEQFNPKKVEYWDTLHSNYDIIPIETLTFPDPNIILTCAYYNNHKEQIQLSYFKSRIVLEHLHTARYVHIQDGSGARLIKQFFDSTKKNLIIIGFEIDIVIQNYHTSIEKNINDKSLYPIVVVDKDHDILKKQVFFINGMDKQPLEIIEFYINQFNFLKDYTNR
jgi:hypothetical protein